VSATAFCVGNIANTAATLTAPTKAKKRLFAFIVIPSIPIAQSDRFDYVADF
jgi:hypothetical protein